MRLSLGALFLCFVCEFRSVFDLRFGHSYDSFLILGSHIMATMEVRLEQTQIVVRARSGWTIEFQLENHAFEKPNMSLCDTSCLVSQSYKDPNHSTRPYSSCRGTLPCLCASAWNTFFSFEISFISSLDGGHSPQGRP